MLAEPPGTLDEAIPSLAPLRRPGLVGRLEGWSPAGGVSGWACPWPLQPQAPPLRLHVVLEDLLDPSGRLAIVELMAAQPRPDLLPLGIEQACGFRFWWSPTHPLPPFSQGLVLRVFAAGEGGPELAGSPLRLDADSYAQIAHQRQHGPAREGALTTLQAPQLQGWGRGPEPLVVRLDGTTTQPIAPPVALPEGPWPFQLILPATLADGRVHHLQLETTGGQVLDQRFDLLPFHLTPWAALQQHARPPFPDELSPLARERYRSLRTWLAWADADGTPLPPDLPLLQRLLEHPLARSGETPPASGGTEPGPDGSATARQPLRLPIAADPLVSILIPVHNQYGVTRRCLAAIAYAPTRIPFEVLVVDDGSVDGTAEALAAEAPGVRLIRHDFARGFNQACCSGAAAARAPVLVLLNNDTEPCAAWLEELLDPFERWTDTGMVGAQLIYPDGRLQEAGGIVWGNGEPWNYGRGGNPHDPRVAYARQVDYASAAAVAIRRDLWNRLGGFSPEFSPAYYEDTDLAFKVRQAGHTVRYTPLARVIHHEGMSCGTDTTASSGLKRFQETHRPLFQQKWAAAFQGPTEPNPAAAELIKDRGILGRALCLDQETPRPDRDAGSHAALVEMGLLQDLGWKVTLLPLNLAWLASYSEELQRRGIELIHAPFVLSLEAFLRERGREFELIYLTRYTVAAQALPLIQRFAPQARLIFCNADLHHLRQLRAARAESLGGDAARRALEAVEEVKRQELAVMREVHLTFSYSEVERAVIEAETLGEAATAPCPWVVQGPEAPAPLEGRSGLAFLGSYGHPPNRDAVEAFLVQVWPLLLQQRPELRLHLYGSGLDATTAARWGAEPGVIVEGWIADPATVYARHRLFVAPLRSGAGLKGKVVAAAAHGIPQVLSPLAAEATGLRHGQEVLIARTPDDWCQAVLRLDGDDDAWRAMGAAAFAYARDTWSRERGLALMADALARLDLPHRSPA
ncbi:putative glycosyltransferase [Cyanobium gracile PCC 6307]|uniref:Putative glycosyltransferase n=2 Tax=Cyanobium gracile TaxID=59930 RepID=K9P5R8_CYAGP|nr:putative glycosyltransferase [Cyanobium gracile PCC 6307]